MNLAKRPPSLQEVLILSRDQFPLERFALSSGLVVAFDLVAESVEDPRHADDYRDAMLLNSVDDLRRIQRVLKEHLAGEYLRHEDSHELTKYVTERKQVQKSHRVNEAFVFEVLLNLGFKRVDVGKHVSMREAHTFWLGGSTRSENDLGNVAVDDFFRREGLTRMNRKNVREVLKHQPRES